MIAIERYYYCCIEDSLGITAEEAEQNGQPVQLAGESGNVLEGYLTSRDFIKLEEVPRLVIRDED